MKSDDKKITKKRRIYQVAREFQISNEALIEVLKRHNFKVRNHMAPVSDAMYEVVCQNFKKEETGGEKESDFRKRLQEKKEEEEARRQAIQHEIDEIIEHTKEEIFEPVEVVKRKKQKKQVVSEKQETITTSRTEEQIPEVSKKKEEKKEIKTEKKQEKKIPEEEKIVEEVKTPSEKPKRHLKRRPKAVEKKKTEKATEEVEEKKGIKARKKRKWRKKTETTQEKTGGETKTSSKRKRRKRKKAAVKIDEKEIEASIKETLAKMSQTPKRKRKKKERVEEVEAEEENVIYTTEFTTVAELANLMEVDSSEVIQACISLGLMVTINQRLDRETILMVADEFGYEVKFLTEYGEEDVESIEKDEPEDPSLLEPRPPVVTIMGHVDHGKTSLLDYIRESNIIAGESGGITQHIGAYEVVLNNNKKITFLDTPGHKAFTAMRARGAQVTDIVVLVIAADDSVMPQTIEAINHARAAGVPIVVAINKIDKPNANPDLIKQQLSDLGILVEEWGGKVQCAEVSAKTGEGIDHLLEIILLEAELLELKANPHGKAKGVLIEAKMAKGKGIVGTVLVQKGTIRIDDYFVAGQYNGRVRAMFDERGHRVKEAPPSTPVQILGFTGMPQAGDLLSVVDSEQEARTISLRRQRLKREQGFRQVRRLTLDQISQRIAEGTVKELAVVIKADVDGSLGALSDSLMELGTKDVAVKIIHKGVGTITESDVLLAKASDAVIIGFHVTPTVQAKELAQREKVDIRLYKVIYDVVNDVKLALSGLLEPEITEEVIGRVEVRELFKASRLGLIAGCYVQSGKVLRNSPVRLIRDGKVIYEGKIASLKRFKEDVKEVSSGYECGIILDNFKDIKVDDTLEVYKIVEIARTL